MKLQSKGSFSLYIGIVLILGIIGISLYIMNYRDLDVEEDWNLHENNIPVEDLERSLIFKKGFLSMDSDPSKGFKPSRQEIGDNAIHALQILREGKGNVGVDLYDRRITLRYYPAKENWSAYKATIILEIDDSSSLPYILELTSQDSITLKHFEQLISTLFPLQKKDFLAEVQKWEKDPEHYQTYITMKPVGDRVVNIQYNIETQSIMFKF